ncbi:MAG TPA: ribose-phosphate diphosphokinase [Kofleriaceae bacterium]
MTIVVAIPGSDGHAGKLAQSLGVELVVPQLRRFPDGELYVRLPKIDDHVVMCGSLYPAPAERFMELALLAGTARDLGASRVGLVAPYLAFMRQDVAFAPGEGVTARYFAKLVSSVIDWMVTVDPHLHRLPSLANVYTIPTAVAHAAPAIADWVRREVAEPVLVGPDAESEQWVAAVAEACGAPFEICTKTRRGDRDVSVALRGRSWNGHTPVLIDDIVSTGKTMIEATRTLRAAGSAPPLCVAIHAVFADALHAELTAAGAAGIVTCNTIPHASNQICVAASIAEAARAFV